VEIIGEMRSTYKIFVTQSEGRRQFARSRHRYKNDNKVGLRETEYEVVDSVQLLDGIRENDNENLESNS
jgi:hypothetical protein